MLIKDLEDEFTAKVGKIKDPEHPLTKPKPSKKEKQRSNRTIDGKRKKYQRKAPAAQRFW